MVNLSMIKRKMGKGKLEFRYVMIKVAVNRKKMSVHNTISIFKKLYMGVHVYQRNSKLCLDNRIMKNFSFLYF